MGKEKFDRSKPHVIDVPDRAHVHMRLAAIKLFLAHGLLQILFVARTVRCNSGRRPSGSSPKTVFSSQFSAFSFVLLAVLNPSTRHEPD